MIGSSTQERLAVGSRRWTMLVVVVVATAAMLTAPGDSMRLARMRLLEHDGTRLAAAGLLVWLLFAVAARATRGHATIRATPRWWRLVYDATAALALAYSGALVARAIATWGVRLDAPIVLYPARLALSGQRVPYREIIDFNQPLTYLVYGAIDALAPSDAALRSVDAALWVGIGVATRHAFPLPSASAAAMTAALFAITHLEDTGVDCLQREMFVLLFALATGAALRARKPVLAGVAFALGFWIKFHSALLVLPFLWDFLRTTGPAHGWRALRTLAGTWLALSVLVLSLLAIGGALDGWLEITTEYLPLYSRMAGTLSFAPTGDLLWHRRLYLFFDPTEHPAILGLFLVPPLLTTSPVPHALSSTDPTRTVVGLYLVSLPYVLVQGTFWHYHSIASFLAIGAMVALLLARPRGLAEGLGRVALVAAVGHWCFGPRAHDTMDWTATGRNEDAVAMARELEVDLPPGESVQPLDVVQGVVDAMRRAHVPLATSFVYDFYLYHDVDSAVVRRWRRRFLRELSRERPFFIIQPDLDRTVQPYGPGTDPAFVELHELLAAHTTCGTAKNEGSSGGDVATPRVATSTTRGCPSRNRGRRTPALESRVCGEQRVDRQLVLDGAVGGVAVGAELAEPVHDAMVLAEHEHREGVDAARAGGQSEHPHERPADAAALHAVDHRHGDLGARRGVGLPHEARDAEARAVLALLDGHERHVVDTVHVRQVVQRRHRERAPAAVEAQIARLGREVVLVGAGERVRVALGDGSDHEVGQASHEPPPCAVGSALPSHGAPAPRPERYFRTDPSGPIRAQRVYRRGDRRRSPCAPSSSSPCSRSPTWAPAAAAPRERTGAPTATAAPARPTWARVVAGTTCGPST